MEALISYFTADPLRILYFLGGAGGIWFWLEKWLDRTRITIRFLAHSIGGSNERPTAKLLLEVVNLGRAPTSLAPHVSVSGFRARRLQPSSPLEILETERLLPPHSTRRISVEGRVPVDYPFWFYKRFRVPITRGSSRSFFLRMAGTNMLGRTRYYAELALYLAFGVRRYFDQSLRDLDVA